MVFLGLKNLDCRYFLTNRKNFVNNLIGFQKNDKNYKIDYSTKSK